MPDGKPILRFDCLVKGGGAVREIVPGNTVIAGWTGRDRDAMEQHIAELEALGVKRPEKTPVFYRVSRSRLTQADAIEVLGKGTSGEVEFVLIRDSDRLWIGVGSDHTDREVETFDVGVSKQLCEKPVAAALWDYAEVCEHWDRLVLRSFIEVGGERELYQQGTVDAMLAPAELVSLYTGGRADLPAGTVMFGGTLAAIGGVRPTPAFAFELFDPVLGRQITHVYRTTDLLEP